MVKGNYRTARSALIGAAVSVAVTAFVAGPVAAQPQDTVGEAFVPTIWVDPDGCEHWVMDDGWEGFMTPHVNRQGLPVCQRGNTCGYCDNPDFRPVFSAHRAFPFHSTLRDSLPQLALPRDEAQA